MEVKGANVVFIMMYIKGNNINKINYTKKTC